MIEYPSFVKTPHPAQGFHMIRDNFVKRSFLLFNNRFRIRFLICFNNNTGVKKVISGEEQREKREKKYFDIQS